MMVELVAQAPQSTAPAPAVFEKYPLTMVHPNARAASAPQLIQGSQTLDALGRPIEGTGSYVAAMPALLPPVLVRNADDEAYHYAQGYRAAGHMDESAFSRLAASPVSAPHTIVEFPKWAAGVLCADAEEEAAALRSANEAGGESDGPTVAPREPQERPTAASPWQEEDMAQMLGRPLQTPAQARMAKARAARKTAKAA